MEITETTEMEESSIYDYIACDNTTYTEKITSQTD